MALVDFQAVRKDYVGRTGRRFTAVSDFRLSLGENEFFCLLGPSGCGKSTILTMLAGFEAPSEGSILVGGAPVIGPERERGVVFQSDNSLYPWLTAIENIEFGLRINGVERSQRRIEANTYLEMVGLKGQQDKYPTELSGGMKQRIQIARALANKPKILLMDEPFGALDAQTRASMQWQLREIWKQTNTTVVFITHDIDEAIVLSTKIGVMGAGPGGTLRRVIDVKMGEDRSRQNPLYIDYYTLIEQTIRAEVDAAMARASN